ncbi:hypothetical protein [Gilvibacter sediminis]|uniref:hypothetical protein n=1 Tax=Gilvibacter sediminis TaxID=379071 RepID=UPI002350398C|nr:hypothetical protein [Gilvibacter sediminis]MDC7999168.1 hypothetical protein [Gilvibacter sediminis]
MKKLLILSLSALFMVACSQDEQELTAPADSAFDLKAFDNSNFGIYEGVFTTDKGDKRATVTIKILDEEVAMATLYFSDGTTTVARSTSPILKGEAIDLVSFEGKEVSFNFSADVDGSNATVSNVIYLKEAADIITAKSTSRAPVTSLTGTYICNTCGNPNPRTFNVMISGDGTGDQTYTAQTSFNGNTFNGNGAQSGCAAAGNFDYCDINDTGSITVGAGSVNWSGTVIYGNGLADCGQLIGQWYFTGSANNKSGIFATDQRCTGIIAAEDFESTPGAYTTSTAEFTDGGTDFFLRTDGSDIGGAYVVDNIVENFFFAAQDIDGEGATLPAYLEFTDITLVTGNEQLFVDLLLAEDDDGSNQDWDDSDNVIVQYSFDNTIWTDIIAIEGELGGSTFNNTPRVDTNGDGFGDGKEVTNVFDNFVGTFQNNSTTNPSGSGTVSIRIQFQLNSGDEDIAIDNFYLLEEVN